MGGFNPRPGRKVMRGYFAVGRQLEDQLFFEIYIPFPGVKNKFPTRRLNNAIGLLAVALLNEGYILKPKAIEYSRKID